MNLFADHFIALLLMAVLLLCSAFFSGTETALFSLTRTQIKRLRAQDHRSEKLLSILAQNPSGLLISVLFGNLVVNIFYFSTSVVISTDLGEQCGKVWGAVSSLIVLLLVILFAEIFPKAVGLSFSERIVQLSSTALRGWFHFMGPVRRILEVAVRRLEPADQDDDSRLNAEELKMLIDATQHDSTFGKQEKAIASDIITFPEIRVHELMVPRVKQFLRRADAPMGEALREAAELEIEIFPIYETHEDNVVGAVEVHDLFVNGESDRPLSDFAVPIRFVPETKRADDVLREFLAEDLRMVCVVDEYGGLAGTVCLEDLLEEVVGEFNVMEAPSVEQLGGSTYRLPGSLSIREWRNLFVGFVPDSTVQSFALDTLSGLVVSLLKRIPKPGDVAQLQNLKFTVENMRGNRIESVRIELADPGGRVSS